MTEQHDLKARLRRAAAMCPWRAGQPAPLLNEAADRITDLEAERDAERAISASQKRIAEKHHAEAVTAESRLALADRLAEAGKLAKASIESMGRQHQLTAQGVAVLSALSYALTAYEENTSSKDLTTGEDDA